MPASCLPPEGMELELARNFQHRTCVRKMRCSWRHILIAASPMNVDGKVRFEKATLKGHPSSCSRIYSKLARIMPQGHEIVNNRESYEKCRGVQICWPGKRDLEL
jgi:hypothetical protein